jgi:PAS domain S-box-containing protein
MLVGLTVLAGWTFNLPLLKSFVPGWGAMAPGTAVSLVLAAGALWLSRAREPSAHSPWVWLARIAAGGVILVGALALLQRALGLNLAIAGPLLPEADAVAELARSRVSLLEAIDLVLLGSALLLTGGKPRPASIQVAQCFALVTAFGAFLALNNHLFGSESLRDPQFFVNMAPHTAATLLLLSFGLFSARPQAGLMSLFIAETAGGVLLRRLSIPVLLMPAVINWLELEGERRGILPVSFGWALDSAMSAFLTGLLVWVVARIVHEKDLARLAIWSALRQREAEFSSAFEHAAIGMALVAPDGRWLRTNRSLRALVGYSAEEFQTRTFQDITHPDDLESDLVHVRAVLAGEIDTYQMEKRYLHKSGQEVVTWLSVSLVRDEGGQPLHFISQIQDITERKQAELALRESERFNRALIEALPAHIAVLDGDGRIIATNRAWRKFAEQTNAPPEQMSQGADYLNAYSRAAAGGDARAATIVALIREIMADGREDALLEFAHMSPQGQQWFQWRASRFVLPGPACVVLTQEDVTPIKRAEEASRQSEARLANLINIAVDAIISVDENQRIRIFNQGAEQIFGYRAAEVLGQPLDMLLPARFVAAHGDHLRNFASTPEQARPMGTRREVFGRRKDGSEFPAEASIAKQRDGGKSSLTVILRDITDRKAADETIRENERALRLIAAATNDALWNWDVINSKVQRNAGFEKHFGYPADVIEPTIEWWSERVHPDDRMVAGAIMREASEGKADDGFYRYRFRRRDGSFATINDHVCFVRDKSGKTVRALGAMTDVTTQVEAEANLRLVLQRLMVAEQDERRRIARELHDSTVQDLVAAMINLDCFREQTAGRTEDEVRQIEDGLALLENSAHEIRTLSYLLHPPLLDETGLIGAIRHYVNGVGERTGLTTSVNIPMELPRLDETVELILFRVVQESLGNTHRHAQAKMAAVRLRQDSSEIVLEISDDGRGIPSQILEPGTMDGLGVGIPGMRERLRQIGGRLEIESNGGGTTVRAIVPATKSEP